MKWFLYISTFLFSISGFSQPANDDCADAITLTIGGGLICGEDGENSTLEGSECFTNYAGGSTEGTMWYRITATNDSLVLNFIETNSTICQPHIAIYGPYATGGGCNPACADQVYDELQAGDPGNHDLITGLSTTAGNADYLIQVQNNSCNGSGVSDIQFCLGIDEPAANGFSTGATLIDECGTVFNETTDGGYWNSGAGTSFADLDSTAGNDVAFVINNFAWNTFCSLTSGTWQITVNGVSNCNVPAPNDGIQAAVFTGTQASLTLEDSQSPINPGDNWTSATITVDSAECAYLGIDGFAGDVCDYQITLTNITGGCVVLPVDFLGLNAYRNENDVHLSWKTMSEVGNQYFIIERSTDGADYEEIGRINSIGDHHIEHVYQFTDDSAPSRNVYYRLSEFSNENEKTTLAIKYIKGETTDDYFNAYPNPTEGLLNVEFSQISPRLNSKIEIYNYQGEIIYSETFESSNGFNSRQINLHDFRSSNYLLRLTNDEKTFSSRILLK